VDGLLLVGELLDPQEPEARLLAGSLRALDQRLPGLASLQRTAALDEPSDLQSETAQPRWPTREQARVVEPVVDVDDVGHGADYHARIDAAMRAQGPGFGGRHPVASRRSTNVAADGLKSFPFLPFLPSSSVQ
jgi:hypothetical protein